jgi:hypothetical protein
MTIADMIQLLVHKNNKWQSINWSIVESIPELHLEKLLEDSLIVSDCISHWTKDTKNILIFQSRWDKYDLFLQPQVIPTIGRTMLKSYTVDSAKFKLQGSLN